MLVSEFSTEPVEQRERFAWWEDVAARSHLRNRLHSDCCDNFLASMRLADLGDLQVSAMALPHLESVRTSTLIRQSDPEVYQIARVLRGPGEVGVAERDTSVRAGDIVVVDSSCPYRVRFRSTPDAWSHLIIQIPRARLSLPEKGMRRLLGVALPGRHGMGGVVTRWLADFNARAGEFAPADVPVLASVFTDLLTSMLSHHLDSEAVMTPEARTQSLQVRIRDFIQQHLADPALTPRAIADAHSISVRHLYTLFHDQDLTVAAWIRQRRLEHCRRDLADPRLASRPVHVIAARWGFLNPAHFSRAFRTAYDIPPSDFRHRALHQSAGAAGNG
jgi:AraC-like DNA-binding protein